MPQDANARLNAKRKATKKLANLKAKAAAAGENAKGSSRSGRDAKKSAE